MKAPDEWKELCDCFSCEYYLYCYELGLPHLRLCEPVLNYLKNKMREDWRQKHGDLPQDDE